MLFVFKNTTERVAVKLSDPAERYLRGVFKRPNVEYFVKEKIRCNQVLKL